MKFDKTDEFAAEWKSMPIDHRRIFRSLTPAFNAACEAYISDSGRQWPASLQVNPMINTNGIREMTWSFAGSDGRATFEFVRSTANQRSDGDVSAITEFAETPRHDERRREVRTPSTRATMPRLLTNAAEHAHGAG